MRTKAGTRVVGDAARASSAAWIPATVDLGSRGTSPGALVALKLNPSVQVAGRKIGDGDSPIGTAARSCRDHHKRAA